MQNLLIYKSNVLEFAFKIKEQILNCTVAKC